MATIALVENPHVISLANWAWGGGGGGSFVSSSTSDNATEVAVDQAHYCLESLPHLPPSCLSRLLAKVVGVCIVLTSCANKAPVINNIVRSNSVVRLP